MSEKERWARDKGMQRAYDAASDSFTRNAVSAYRYLARQQIEWNTDEVHERFAELDQPMERPLALGQLTSQMIRKRLIYKTGNRRRSSIEGAHLRDYPLYMGAGWPPPPLRRP